MIIILEIFLVKGISESFDMFILLKFRTSEIQILIFTKDSLEFQNCVLNFEFEHINSISIT